MLGSSLGWSVGYTSPRAMLIPKRACGPAQVRQEVGLRASKRKRLLCRTSGQSRCNFLSVFRFDIIEEDALELFWPQVRQFHFHRVLDIRFNVGYIGIKSSEGG